MLRRAAKHLGKCHLLCFFSDLSQGIWFGQNKNQVKKNLGLRGITI